MTTHSPPVPTRERDPVGQLRDPVDRLAYMFGRGFALAFSPGCALPNAEAAHTFAIPDGLPACVEDITDPNDAMRYAFWMTLAGQAGLLRAAS